jgi:hypothetical protein
LVVSLLRLDSIRNRLPRSPGARDVVIGLLFVLGSLVAFHSLLAPVGGRFYDGDFVTPTTPAELRYYLAAFSGPWNPESITAGFNPFFTNDFLLFSAVGAFSAVLGSLGGGMLAVFLLVEAALAASLFVASRRMGVGRPWALVGALAFAASPVVFDRTVSGHELILAAAVFVPPLLVLLSEAASRPVSLRVVVVLGLLWGVVGLLEYHIFYLVGFAWGTAVLAVVLRIVVGSRRTAWSTRLRDGERRVAALLGSLFVAIGVNLVWLVPAFDSGGQSSVLADSTVTTRWILGYTQTGIQPTNVFAANVYWGQMYTEAWGKVGHLAIGLVVSALLSAVFVAVLFWHAYHRSGPTDALVLIALVFLLLSTGTILPGSPYLWLLQHIPFFSVNDDPAKFDVLLAPALSLLLANALQGEWRLSRRPPVAVGTVPPYRWRRIGQGLRRQAVPCALVVIVLSAAPFATGNFAGRVAHVPDSPGALATANRLDATVPPDGRVALFPPDPYEYAGHGQSPTNPLVVDPPGNALYLPAPPGLEPLNLGTEAAAWAYASFYSNATSHGGSLFGLLGATSWVVDLAAQPSPKTGPFGWDNPYTLSLVLQHQTDLGPNVTNLQTRVFAMENATPGPLTLRGPPVLALADREFLLDAAYLPNGDQWVGSTAFDLQPGSPTPGISFSNSTAPFVETPEGALDEVFQQLPVGAVVPVEPIAWSIMDSGTLPTYGLWAPWEQNFGLEDGRPLGSLSGYVTTGNQTVGLPVPLATSGGPTSEVWADLFYGPQEGTLQVDLNGQLPVTVSAYAVEPLGFHWTAVEPLRNSTSATLFNAGGGVSTVAAVAAVAPGAFRTAENATLLWLAGNGAGASDPPVLWIKGDDGVEYGTWTQRSTGSADAQGWGSIVDPDGAFSTTFLLPERTTLGVLARATGNGVVYVSACPVESLTDDAVFPCPNLTEVSFTNSTPTWSASDGNLTVGPGVVRVNVYDAARSVLLDQLLLTPSAASLLSPCASAPGSEWTCEASAAAPTSLSGNPGGPQLSATFARSTSAGVLVHLVSCDAPWTATGPDVRDAPFLVDGWACGYSTIAGFTSVAVGLPALERAAAIGLLGSVVVAVPAVVVAVVGWPLSRWVRRLRGRSATEATPPPATPPPTGP